MSNISGLDYKPKKSISIVVGHTQASPGAMAVSPLSMHEYDYNRGLAIMISDVLAKDNFIFVAFRDGLGLPKTYDELEGLGLDLNIELHFNAEITGKVRGTETLCSKNGIEFAKIVQSNLCIALKRDGIRNRGVKILGPQDRGWHSVSRLKCPNILVEPFFGSNEEDARMGLESKSDIAKSIIFSVNQWFDRLTDRGRVP